MKDRIMPEGDPAEEFAQVVRAGFVLARVRTEDARRPPWVVWEGGAWHCTRCGARVEHPVNGPLDGAIAFLRAFSSAHRNCQERPQGPAGESGTAGTVDFPETSRKSRGGAPRGLHGYMTDCNQRG